MSCIHENDICYRSLKPHSVLLDENLEPILCYFGFGKFFTDYTTQALNGGYHHYLAPELIAVLTSGFEKVGELLGCAVDVFSYGVMLRELFSNDCCFGDDLRSSGEGKLMSAISKGRRLSRSEGIPDFYWNLIEKCWDHNPNERPYFSQIIEELRANRLQYAFWEGVDMDELIKYEDRILSECRRVDFVSSKGVLAE
jgi:serine/threonine protein kinase